MPRRISDPWLRFCANVDKNGPIPVHRPDLGQCWIWTLYARRGYGQFAFSGRIVSAHRFALEHKLGRPLGHGLCACHHCDNPLCVRESHLFEGTRAANNVDMARKGRAAKGDRHASVTHPERVPRGESKRDTKLTVDAVREIRAAFAAGEQQSVLAMRFGVNSETIRNVVVRNTWKHVEENDLD
jgi:hypothetical protein